MAKLYLVWNGAQNECVGFMDKGSADYAATGRVKYLKGRFGRPTLAEEFRDCYGEDAPRLPQTVVELPE